MIARTAYVLLADIVAIFLSLLISSSLAGIEIGTDFVLIVILIRLMIFRIFRLYYLISRYIDIKDILLIFSSVLLSSIIIYPIRENMIFSLADQLLLLIFVVIIRLSPDIIRKINRKNSHNRKILIYGAGDAGDMILSEILKHPEYGVNVVGFLDDNPEKRGKYIKNHKIFGGLSKSYNVISATGAEEILLAIPSADSDTIGKIFRKLSACNVRISVLPAESELIDGRVFLRDSRKFDINDILRRTPHERDLPGLRELIKDRRILVTGAGGSIGSELCRQILNFSPELLVCLGHGENSIFSLRKTLDLSQGNVEFCIADIQDRERISEIMRKYDVKIVFHAAAHKHVQLMEENPREAFKNNIIGSRNIFEICGENRVEKVVLISTDKAVEPTSVMGMSKRVAEKLLCSISGNYPETAYISVRFGNVLGSRGSVIPIFEEQIKNGGPVTVTHPDVERFFMSIPEAVQLTLEASINGKSGEIYILDMGRPVRISDIARKMIEIYSPEKEISIIFTGLKKGEKITERLFSEKERPVMTDNSKIMVMRHCCIEDGFVDKVSDYAERLDEIEDRDAICVLEELSS